MNKYVHTDTHAYYRFFSYTGNFETSIQGESFVNHVDLCKDICHRGAKSTQVSPNRWSNKNNSLTFSSLYAVSPEAQQQQHHCQDAPQRAHNSRAAAGVKQRGWELCVVQPGDTSATFPSWSQLDSSNIFLPALYIQSHSFLMMPVSINCKFTCPFANFLRAVFGCTQAQVHQQTVDSYSSLVSLSFFSNFSLKGRGNTASACCAHWGLNLWGRCLVVQLMPCACCQVEFGVLNKRRFIRAQRAKAMNTGAWAIT